MIKQNMYADISSYFNNDAYPGLKAAFSASYLAQVTDASGAIYAVPITQAANDLQCIFYRADLAEKYGITVDSMPTARITPLPTRVAPWRTGPPGRTGWCG